MSKLLSDEELQDAIYDIAVCNVQDSETGEMMYAIPPAKIIDLINTQKRLYAEMVVGDDQSEHLAKEKAPSVKKYLD